MAKPKVAFICVHNSCRSQIAEALGKLLASEVFESYSAGTVKTALNPDAVRLMRSKYQLDLTQSQTSKTLAALPAVDIVITMGCNVSCPALPCRYREDWGISDPTGKDDATFEAVIATIEAKVRQLARRITAGEFENDV
ncbi:arsenate reductase ArsC [Ligilactobacillus agilis]|uniref:Arsenate reductase ArsC n=1 Tax=Ligilactobacillus agilis TaxID=1601 RepID=A0A9Q9N144_9LACO|nr:arsenate reductase ArsC [Ligilactobacillus agilis]UXC64235.1 arsenate reductase ArsC [Ligilactobacillus agilis]UXC66234.1 arsenate reductase ArsC [Ligilactobacillus agilis]